MKYRDALDAGFPVFGLYAIDENGQCECPLEYCNSAGKHPMSQSWEHSQMWTEEQLENLEAIDSFNSGYGIVLNKALFIIDIDERNGGVDSYKKLTDRFPEIISACTYMVNSGSGGGSKHLYFSLSTSNSLRSRDISYPGIDFKFSGYVVGEGSKHKSGNKYTKAFGSISELQPAPEALLAFLTKQHDTSTCDTTWGSGELEQLLNAISCYDDYHDWISVGMAIHHETEGNGIDLWDSWSSQSSSYDKSAIKEKWQTFNSDGEKVTAGTLVRLAKLEGFERSVTFECTDFDEPEPEQAPGSLPFSVSEFDLLRPPGFVGKIAEWMRTQSYEEPLEHLISITALTAVGNVIGLHTVDSYGISPNLISLCVAESSAGKEGVQQSFSKLMRVAGLSGAIAGDIKSKQEIIRNLVDHQAVFYLIDELGEILKTIEQAKKKGGSPYLEGITGMLLALSTKANGSYYVTGDLKREMLAGMNRAIAQNEDNPKVIDKIEKKMAEIKEKGLVNPFLSLIGYSVSQSMDCIMTENMAKNGFLSRALLVIEPRDNPRPNLLARGATEVPLAIELPLLAMSTSKKMDSDRIGYSKKKTVIKDTPEAQKLLSELRLWQHNYAEYHKNTTGFTPLIRRCFENICKISLILSAHKKERTVEQVKWAAKFIKNDVDTKIRHIEFIKSKQSKDRKEVRNGIEGRILNVCAGEGESKSVILQRCARKDVSKENISELLDSMVRLNKIEIVKREYRKGCFALKYKKLSS